MDKAMSTKLPFRGLKQVEEIYKFNEDFIKNYIRDSNIGYFLKVDFQYPEELNEFHNHFPFLSEAMNIGNVKKLLANLYGKKDYVKHIRKSKKSLNQKMHRVIKFNKRV